MQDAFLINRKMENRSYYLFKTALAVALTLLVAAGSFAQTATTGTVTMSATASRYVEINSGGSVTLAGNSGGGITTNGTLYNPLAVAINLGELGPSNTSSFVTATVPFRLRSNAGYVVSVQANVTSSGTTPERITAADIGFGLGGITVTGGVGVGAGTDSNATAGNPTLAANGSVNTTTGRFEFTTTRSNLGAFTSSTTALSGTFINNAVPRSNTSALNVPAIFAIKPQYYEAGTTTATVTFTMTAP